jgi:hypothetical protein
LLSHGLTPVFDLDVLRAMWRRHGDCGLAVRLWGRGSAA